MFWQCSESSTQQVLSTKGRKIDLKLQKDAEWNVSNNTGSLGSYVDCSRSVSFLTDACEMDDWKTQLKCFCVDKVLDTVQKTILHPARMISYKHCPCVSILCSVWAIFVWRCHYTYATVTAQLHHEPDSKCNLLPQVVFPIQVWKLDWTTGKPLTRDFLRFVYNPFT